eukprot:113563-Lingulodinium_polyedra.AAC.1
MSRWAGRCSTPPISPAPVRPGPIATDARPNRCGRRAWAGRAQTGGRTQLHGTTRAFEEKHSQVLASGLPR